MLTVHLLASKQTYARYCFDIVGDQSDVHRRAVKETTISGHPQSDQLRSGKPDGETWYTHYYHYI